jgi:hypothetical protein
MAFRMPSFNAALMLASALALFLIGSQSDAANRRPPGESSTLAPPTIPATGAYIGAWVNPQGLPLLNGASELAALARFNGYVGKPVSILHVFVSFTVPIPTDILSLVDQNGSIPMIDLECVSVDQINAGQWDSQLAAYAQTMIQFAKPVFFRWYWEMNLNSTDTKPCGGFNNAPGYVMAWQRIWNIFQQAGATNVAFVWCPIAHGRADLQYYPGDSFVDWVAADSFDRTGGGAAAFQVSFDDFYNEWAARKPMMVGATGATLAGQYQYIEGIKQLLPTTYPGIKAVMYFDAPGDYADWALGGNGITAFRDLVNTPYFSYR